MELKANLSKVYIPSGDIVAREIEGELIIVPVVAGIGDIEDELYALNDPGKAIWEKLDGKRTLNDIVQELFLEFESPKSQIEEDVTGLVEELLKRKMLVEA
jgi:hypothetical protein